MLDLKAEVVTCLRARCTLLWIKSSDELRAAATLSEAAFEAGYDCRFWDVYSGLTDAAGVVLDRSLTDAADVLRRVEKDPDRAVYVLRDFHQWLDPVTIRGLRTVSTALLSAPKTSAKTIIVLSPSGKLPEEIENQTVFLDYPLPDRSEVERLLDDAVSGLDPEARSAAIGDDRGRIVDAALGLSADQIATALAKSLVSNGRRIDPGAVAAQKQSVISSTPGLTWERPDPRGFAGVAGNEGGKAFTSERKAAFSDAARAYGLPAPKGILLVGVPGCGKTLFAKCVAGDWAMPLVRLDLGAVFDKFVGGSESQMNAALKVVEALAPVVLWIDEIEKGFAGTGGDQGDGGVGKRVFGAFLSWLQEREGAVFVVATANDVTGLPPELLRKGRFDEVFFVDLPTPTERRAVLEVTLRQYQRDPETIGDLSGLVARTEGWSGAELASIVPSGMYRAFNDGARPLTVADLETAAADVVPLSSTAREKIDALRQWAIGRARPASRPQETVEAPRGRALDI